MDAAFSALGVPPERRTLAVALATSVVAALIALLFMVVLPAQRKAREAAARLAQIKAARVALGPAKATELGAQLLAACAAKHPIDALRLVNEGADTDVISLRGKAALDFASEDKGLTAVAAAIKDVGGHTGAEIIKAAGAKAKAAQGTIGETKSSEKGALLIAACEGRRVAEALSLISEGADPNFLTNDGNSISPLMSASCTDDFYSVAAILIEAGAKIGQTGQGLVEGISPLVFACKSKSYATAKLLIDAGAPLNAVGLFPFEGPFGMVLRQERTALDLTEDTPFGAIIKERGGLTSKEVDEAAKKAAAVEAKRKAAATK
jgi:hypothetical protein